MDLAALVECGRRHASSQRSEDLILLPTLLRAAFAKQGTFVELGALDGLAYSNTLLLEKCFGWSGVLIEADPSNFKRLLKNGRSACKLHSAVCNKTSGSVQFASTDKHGELAGQLDQLSPSYIRRWGLRFKPVTVNCTSLTRLMGRAAMRKADFLSLDVQGAEELVLSSVDPSVFKVVLVEIEGNDEQRDERVRSHLLRAGLRLSSSPMMQAVSSEIYLAPGVVEVPWNRVLNMTVGYPKLLWAKNRTLRKEHDSLVLAHHNELVEQSIGIAFNDGHLRKPPPRNDQSQLKHSCEPR